MVSKNSSAAMSRRFVDQRHRLLDLVDRQKASPVALVVEPRQRVVDAEAGELEPQVLAGDGFERVCLVDDRDFVIRQQSDTRPRAGPGR